MVARLALTLPVVLAALFAAPAFAQDAAPTPAVQPAPAPSDPAVPPVPPPSDPAVIPPAPAATDPAATPAAPAEAAPAPAPAIAAPSVVPAPASLATPVAAADEANTHSPMPTRILMDVVSGLGGAAVILALGLGVAAPLALLPWIIQPLLPAALVFGIPASLFISGGLVAAVLVGAVAGSAVLQRFVRPLLGRQPSMLGPVIGAVFFGAVGAAIGLVASYLLVTTTLEPVNSLRNQLIGDWTKLDPRAMALTGALVVGLAVPFAAAGAGIGGPISAEVEDSRHVEANASAKQAPVNARASN